MRSSSKLPSSFRVTVFLLRVALGLNFLYFGFAVLFDATLGKSLRYQSFGDLYSWLSAPASAGWIHPVAQWAFLLIGVCLILGLVVRIASILGIGVLLLSFLPTVSYSAPDPVQFINGEVIIILCLMILFLANAGVYLGLDTFIHISLRHKAE